MTELKDHSHTIDISPMNPSYGISYALLKLLTRFYILFSLIRLVTLPLVITTRDFRTNWEGIKYSSNQEVVERDWNFLFEYEVYVGVVLGLILLLYLHKGLKDFNKKAKYLSLLWLISSILIYVAFIENRADSTIISPIYSYEFMYLNPMLDHVLNIFPNLFSLSFLIDLTLYGTLDNQFYKIFEQSILIFAILYFLIAFYSFYLNNNLKKQFNQAGFDSQEEYRQARKAGFISKKQMDLASASGFSRLSAYKEMIDKGFETKIEMEDTLMQGYLSKEELIMSTSLLETVEAMKVIYEAAELPLAQIALDSRIKQGKVEFYIRRLIASDKLNAKIDKKDTKKKQKWTLSFQV